MCIYIYIFIPSYFFSLSSFFIFLFFYYSQRIRLPTDFFRRSSPIKLSGLIWWFFESRPRNDTLELLVTRVTFIVDLTFSLEIVSCYSCFVQHFIARLVFNQCI